MTGRELIKIRVMGVREKKEKQNKMERRQRMRGRERRERRERRGRNYLLDSQVLSLMSLRDGHINTAHIASI